MTTTDFNLLFSALRAIRRAADLARPDLVEMIVVSTNVSLKDLEYDPFNNVESSRLDLKAAIGHSITQLS